MDEIYDNLPADIRDFYIGPAIRVLPGTSVKDDPRYVDFPSEILYYVSVSSAYAARSLDSPSSTPRLAEPVEARTRYGDAKARFLAPGDTPPAVDLTSPVRVRRRPVRRTNSL